MALRSDYPLVTERQFRVLSTLARRGAVEVLTALLREPNREFAVRELADEVGVPAMSCSRILRDLHALRVVRRRRVGRALAVSLETESPTTDFLVRLFRLCQYE